LGHPISLRVIGSISAHWPTVWVGPGVHVDDGSGIRVEALNLRFLIGDLAKSI